jgi:hypothetical protein
MQDRNGWPIVEDARVHVPPRPGLDGIGEVAGFGALVVEIQEDRVELEELLSFNRRTVRPGDCVVQSGETQASLQHRAIRKGGRQFLAERQRQQAVREQRAARKAEAEED